MRTLLLAAAKEDRWVRQDLLLRSEDEEWLEECVAEPAPMTLRCAPAGLERRAAVARRDVLNGGGAGARRWGR